jgi:hypothetical protein
MKKQLLFVLIFVVLLILAYILIAPSSKQSGAYFNGHTYLLLNTSFPGNFTFFAWVYYKSFNGTGVIASQGISEGTHSTWYVGAGGEISNMTACGVFSDERVQGNYTAGWRFATAPFIGTGSWHMIACTYNKSYISIYIDGKLVNKTATPYKVFGAKVIEIGKRTSTFYINGKIPTFAYFNGYLNDVQFYNTSLNSSEIYSLYMRGLGGSPLSNVAIYLPFRNNNFTNGCIEYGKPCNLSVIST